MPSPDGQRNHMPPAGRYVPPPPPPPLANPPVGGFPVAVPTPPPPVPPVREVVPPPASAQSTIRPTDTKPAMPRPVIARPATGNPSVAVPQPNSPPNKPGARRVPTHTPPAAPAHDLLGQPRRIQVPAEMKSANYVGQSAWRREKPQTASAPDGDGEELVEKKNFITEAPPFLVSLVFHLLLLLILGLLARVAEPGPFSLIVSWGPEKGQDAEELAVFNIDPSPIVAEVEIQPETVESKIEVMPEVKMNLVSPVGVKESSSEVQEVSVAIVPSVPAGGMTAGRIGASKESLLKLFGGSPVTEDAVKLGLRWLAKQQSRTEGSWSLKGPYRDGTIFGDNKTAATAMAMLAFLGSGHTHRNGDYKANMEAAVRWLVKQQDNEGNLVKAAPRDQKLYAHAQATMALCEIYGMTNDSSLRGPAQLAINYCIECQAREGGWRYEPRYDSDTSVTGWFVMALMSGRAAGLEVPPSRLDLINRYLNQVQHDDGATYAYQPKDAPSDSMTAEGLLSRMYLGWDHDRPALQLGVGVLTNDFPFDYDKRNVYYWYYATQVMHHFGGSPWDQWNRRMSVELPAAQIKLGNDAGSWAPQGDEWGEGIGRLFTTCLSIYCLEVYYRHMPLYKESALRFSEDQPKKDPPMMVDPSMLKE